MKLDVVTFEQREKRQPWQELIEEQDCLTAADPRTQHHFLVKSPSASLALGKAKCQCGEAIARGPGLCDLRFLGASSFHMLRRYVSSGWCQPCNEHILGF